jgi:hypothetical protein
MGARVETEAGEVSGIAWCYWRYALDFIDGFSRQPRENLGRVRGGRLLKESECLS